MPNHEFQDQGPRPVESDTVFSNYVYTFPEVMTRDFVQITLAQETGSLSNTNKFLGFGQADTSFEYFIDRSITQDYDPRDKRTFFSSADARE